MKSTDVALPAIERCPSCGAGTTRRFETDTFTYGTGSDAVNLTATVPVFACATCGTTFTTSEAEDLRHETVCRHLGVLTPGEIKSLRSQYGLSRSEFARLTRIGEATLARWERGSLVQNAGYDQLLRLLAFPENLQRLIPLQQTHELAATPLATFRYLTRTPDLEEARAAFHLRKATR
jgi:putative zinc finger/helix-turn-helix YgiT family protein